MKTIEETNAILRRNHQIDNGMPITPWKQEPLSVQNAIGPGMDSNTVRVDIPSFIVVRTPQEKADLDSFIGSIVEATRKNCLEKFGQMLKEQNLLIDKFVNDLERTR
jgi:hypothetical protein